MEFLDPGVRVVQVVMYTSFNIVSARAGNQQVLMITACLLVLAISDSGNNGQCWDIARHVVQINDFKLCADFSVISSPVKLMTLLIDHKHHHLQCTFSY